MYGGGVGDPALDGATVLVETIPGAAGFALRERLVERLGHPKAPTHSLAVDLDIRQESAALTRDDITTRYLVLGTATFRLVPLAAGAPIAGAVAAQTAYSAPADDTASAFAMRAAALAAEERVAQALADRIALRLSVLDWLGDLGEPSP